MNSFRIAGVQMDIKFGEPQANRDKMRAQLEQTAGAGAQLTVFPECTTTGYCFDSQGDALPYCEPADGTSVQQVSQWCRELTTHVVFGYLELDGEQIFNSLALVGPEGVIGRYRKMHLPFLGIDRFTTPATTPPEVFETPMGKIGMNICYDSSFPEAARILTLKGADLIVLPTNWPPTSGLTADLIPNARALENQVYFMSVNRVGKERGFEFIGKSKICDPAGNELAFANHDGEEILYGEIRPERARQKHLVNIPGEHEVHRINDRRPELYDALTKPNETWER